MQALADNVQDDPESNGSKQISLWRCTYVVCKVL